MAVVQTDRRLVVTLPNARGRAWPLIGMGVFLLLGSVVIGAFALPSIASSGPISPPAYAFFAGCVLLVCALAWATLDQALARLRPIEVIVDPESQTLIVPRYGAFSASPNGRLTIPLADVVRVSAFETGLKGVARGKVRVGRDVEDDYLFPSDAIAPFAALETFAMEIAEAVESARVAPPRAGDA